MRLLSFLGITSEENTSRSNSTADLMRKRMSSVDESILEYDANQDKVAMQFLPRLKTPVSKQGKGYSREAITKFFHRRKARLAHNAMDVNYKYKRPGNTISSEMLAELSQPQELRFVAMRTKDGQLEESVDHALEELYFTPVTTNEGSFALRLRDIVGESVVDDSEEYAPNVYANQTEFQAYFVENPKGERQKIELYEYDTFARKHDEDEAPVYGNNPPALESINYDSTSLNPHAYGNQCITLEIGFYYSQLSGIKNRQKTKEEDAHLYDNAASKEDTPFYGKLETEKKQKTSQDEPVYGNVLATKNGPIYGNSTDYQAGYCAATDDTVYGNQEDKDDVLYAIPERITRLFPTKNQAREAFDLYVSISKKQQMTNLGLDEEGVYGNNTCEYNDAYEKVREQLKNHPENIQYQALGYLAGAADKLAEEHIYEQITDPAVQKYTDYVYATLFKDQDYQKIAKQLEQYQKLGASLLAALALKAKRAGKNPSSEDYFKFDYNNNTQNFIIICDGLDYEISRIDSENEVLIKKVLVEDEGFSENSDVVSEIAAVSPVDSSSEGQGRQRRNTAGSAADSGISTGSRSDAEYPLVEEDYSVPSPVNSSQAKAEFAREQQDNRTHYATVDIGRRISGGIFVPTSFIIHSRTNPPLQQSGYRLLRENTEEKEGDDVANRKARTPVISARTACIVVTLTSAAIAIAAAAGGAVAAVTAASSSHLPPSSDSQQNFLSTSDLTLSEGQSGVLPFGLNLADATTLFSLMISGLTAGAKLINHSLISSANETAVSLTDELGFELGNNVTVVPGAHQKGAMPLNVQACIAQNGTQVGCQSSTLMVNFTPVANGFSNDLIITPNQMNITGDASTSHEIALDLSSLTLVDSSEEIVQLLSFSADSGDFPASLTVSSGDGLQSFTIHSVDTPVDVSGWGNPIRLSFVGESSFNVKVQAQSLEPDNHAMSTPVEAQMQVLFVPMAVMSSMVSAAEATSLAALPVQTSIVNGQAVTSVMNIAESTALPAAPAQTSAIDEVQGTSVYNGAESTALPEAPAQTSAVDEVQVTSAYNVAETTAFPEAPAQTSVVDEMQVTSVYNGAESTALPELPAQTSAFTAVESTKLPEASIQTSAANVAPAPTSTVAIDAAISPTPSASSVHGNAQTSSAAASSSIVSSAFQAVTSLAESAQVTASSIRATVSPTPSATSSSTAQSSSVKVSSAAASLFSSSLASSSVGAKASSSATVSSVAAAQQTQPAYGPNWVGDCTTLGSTPGDQCTAIRAHSICNCLRGGSNPGAVFGCKTSPGCS